jgi:hypothetical protein
MLAISSGDKPVLRLVLLLITCMHLNPPDETEADIPCHYVRCSVLCTESHCTSWAKQSMLRAT